MPVIGIIWEVVVVLTARTLARWQLRIKLPLKAVERVNEVFGERFTAHRSANLAKLLDYGALLIANEPQYEAFDAARVKDSLGEDQVFQVNLTNEFRPVVKAIAPLFGTQGNLARAARESMLVGLLKHHNLAVPTGTFGFFPAVEMEQRINERRKRAEELEKVRERLARRAARP